MFVGRVIKTKNECNVVQALDLVLVELIPLSAGLAFALEDSMSSKGEHPGSRYLIDTCQHGVLL